MNRRRCLLYALATLMCCSEWLSAQLSTSFPIQGSQEVPPVATEASGECSVTVDVVLKSMSVSCTHDADGTIASHVHSAPEGSNGGVVFGLGDGSSPIEAEWNNMTENQLQTTLSGGYYVNVHTESFPAGELRGQIVFPEDAIAPIPTLSEWGIILLASLLAGWAVISLRKPA